MEVHQLDGHDHGLGHGVVELDICFACQGIWFDHRENLKLSPQAVVELFTLLHQHRTDERRPLQRQLACPRCVRPCPERRRARPAKRSFSRAIASTSSLTAPR